MHKTDQPKFIVSIRCNQSSIYVLHESIDLFIFFFKMAENLKLLGQYQFQIPEMDISIYF